MCTRQRIEQELNQAVVSMNPHESRAVEGMVRGIQDCVPNEKTREMMYDLVHLILIQSEQIRKLKAHECEHPLQDTLRRMDMARGEN